MENDGLKDNVSVHAFEVSGDDEALMRLVSMMSAQTAADRVRAAAYRKFQISAWAVFGAAVVNVAVWLTLLLNGGA